ncbi:hypothetical protein SKAU_G00309320 [Synaphobranchus kaupii]|uniref:Uncharacterized protein n=1 Tax=Synaphobranchus kaupii TaxID=118154 RepID=A0A9Q1IKW2_SYNKA|nr:hypothetical protein SKAU_G00309320 [Synaphobranchus kaupii]
MSPLLCIGRRQPGETFSGSDSVPRESWGQGCDGSCGGERTFVYHPFVIDCEPLYPAVLFWDKAQPPHPAKPCRVPSCRPPTTVPHSARNPSRGSACPHVALPGGRWDGESGAGRPSRSEERPGLEASPYAHARLALTGGENRGLHSA